MPSSFTASCLTSILAIVSYWANGAAGYEYKTHYFRVPVDHFSYTINDTFLMKYLINDTYWESSKGPIFFYAGNESPIEDFCENTGFMWDIFKEFGALIVFAEHRYYGDSLPYGAKSYDKERLGYLTSEQAIADYADLLTHLKHKGSATLQPLYEDGNTYDDTPFVDRIVSGSNPVVAFGGSYGGMLAAWFRMKYPAIVEGAIASSAPIWYFTGLTPCGAFYNVTSSVYMNTSNECGLSIRASWKAIDNITRTAEGKSWLSTKWKLCTPLTNDDLVWNLKSWINDAYVTLAMSNYPYPTNFGTPLPGNPVKELCKSMSNHEEDIYKLLSSVFKGLNVYFNHTGSSECLNFAQSPIGDSYKGWNFQTCTELVMPMCSNGITDIFENLPWKFSDWDQFCFETYNVHPSISIVEETYGGKNLYAASNIIFSNGLLDPWSSGGVLQNISKTVRAVIMPEAAHHLDLRASNVNDPESVVKARELHKYWIKHWIHNYQKPSTPSSSDE